MTIRRGAELGAQIAELAVPQGMLALWALGQSGFVIKSSQTLAVIDPYLSDAIHSTGGPESCFPPPLEPDMLRGVDLILCTHEHPDHTDPVTLRPLLAASPDAQLVASAQSLKILEEAGIDTGRARVPTLDERYTIAGGDYRAIPAAHYALEIEAQRSRWMGFVLRCGDITLLHSGDTILVPEIIQALEGEQVDLALLPINGRDYFREQQDLVGNLL
ncbi:MAG: MBL fold metallo-hydrolase, partial [Chloroflexi bacterium]|nr:MBL fold metallo-hydrolase [Chloroflexota bacterium]